MSVASSACKVINSLFILPYHKSSFLLPHTWLLNPHPPCKTKSDNRAKVIYLHDVLPQKVRTFPQRKKISTQKWTETEKMTFTPYSFDKLSGILGWHTDTHTTSFTQTHPRDWNGNFCVSFFSFSRSACGWLLMKHLRFMAVIRGRSWCLLKMVKANKKRERAFFFCLLLSPKRWYLVVWLWWCSCDHCA